MALVVAAATGTGVGWLATRSNGTAAPVVARGEGLFDAGRGIIWAQVGADIYRSIDDGAHWRTVLTDVDPRNLYGCPCPGSQTFSALRTPGWHGAPTRRHQLTLCGCGAALTAGRAGSQEGSSRTSRATKTGEPYDDAVFTVAEEPDGESQLHLFTLDDPGLWQFRSRLSREELTIPDVSDEEWESFHAIIAEA